MNNNFIACFVFFNYQYKYIKCNLDNINGMIKMILKIFFVKF